MEHPQGFPEQYRVLPEVAKRVLEVAQRFGNFVLRTPTVHPYMSNHFRGAAEMLDQQLYEQGRLDI